MAYRILVADDDPHIREIICFALDKAGMHPSTAKDGAEALLRFEERVPDLIVLDIGMPEMDGLEVCRRIRRTSDVPVLFLSARDEEVDRIIGLEIGGDDYVTKPFSPRELVARVNVILKRRQPNAVPLAAHLGRGELRLDPAGHVVLFAGEPVALTALEFAILQLLLARSGQVFSRGQILDAVYGGVHVADRTIDSHVRNIRGKFAAIGCASIIDTVHGIGFRIGQCRGSA